MTYCKKLMLYDNRITGESVAMLLESEHNYFTGKDDWFLVWLISNGKTTKRIEKKISEDTASKLKEL
jgi:hypothetical protein